MSTVSEIPSARVCTRAFEPTPRSGPESSQSRIRWSVNDSWFAITSRKSNTLSRFCGTSTETVTGLGISRMVPWGALASPGDVRPRDHPRHRPGRVGAFLRHGAHRARHRQDVPDADVLR